MNRLSDQQIVEALINRDGSVLQACYDLHSYDTIAHIKDRFRFDTDTAQDIFQEVMIALWLNTAKPNFKLTARLRTYLFAIAVNQCRKFLDKNRNVISLDEYMLKDKFETREVTTIRDIILEQCLQRLKVDQQKLIRLHYYESLPTDRIAQIMKFNGRHSLKSSKHRAFRRLSEIVTEKYTIKDFQTEISYF